MLNNLRKPLEPVVNLIASPFTFLHPNVLSFVSFLVAAPGLYFLSQGNEFLGSLFIFGVMFDMIDGAVARKTGKTSRFGGMLDATLDRVMDGLILLAIGMGGLVAWELLFVTYMGFVLVSYIKAKAEAVAAETSVGTNRFSVGIAQRGERIAILFVGILADHFLASDSHDVLTVVVVILAVLSMITVFWRAVVIDIELKKKD